MVFLDFDIVINLLMLGLEIFWTVSNSVQRFIMKLKLVQIQNLRTAIVMFWNHMANHDNIYRENFEYYSMLVENKNKEK